MKIAIVVGHNARAQGAVRVSDGASEFVWNGDLAARIAALDPGAVKVFRRLAGGGYGQEIARVYGEVDAWGADCSIELHFNGSANRHAQGCLTLSSGTQSSQALAQAVQRRMQRVMRNRDRGVQLRDRRQRGGASLWQGRAPAILTEPYFGSHPEFCLLAEQRKDALARAIFDGAVAFCTDHSVGQG